MMFSITTGVDRFVDMFTEGIFENSLLWSGIFVVTLIIAGVYITLKYASEGRI